VARCMRSDDSMWWQGLGGKWLSGLREWVVIGERGGRRERDWRPQVDFRGLIHYFTASDSPLSLHLPSQHL